ncbi:ethanolaminephosphotransferase 1 [Musca domestica]|uniref:Ethanolaminephosphotransferase 1 n=1 Tax=Musca domestica TaxID=7370 RepID=A0A1I8N234_MUSDO|nr:ethanolaminephosphotransferase 1 [Musca domestica]XP_011296088.1 ethanolaminephosphotransferase 1 [Musca domestica]XP_011296089.1 ethanolaminephosphotransferase 1 [Musca domestica]XP_019895355.1 ethanolaminephosphotransferase 1 [Musca domestica]XP_058985523.1 ethanolaminephosphotransferase 1 [Musca domestica]XP_058985524.1 ethanolaminephosphotransferase 1 [Musca domestica]XP_058985525.1 ethanolaminephosphotransferase 1 [Musca domestica]
MTLLQQLLNYKYLSKEHLNGFDNYKYSARDTSPLSVYVMHPFWNWIVKFFPRWLAPNVMTFLGFLCTALNFLLLSYYDWNFYASSGLEGTQPIPSWVWLCTAINIFLAYTLDGIDGKQARRIGLSGPLGELFDHGLDSYTAVLIPTCLYSIFGRSPVYSVAPIRMYYVCWMVFFNFYVSHWEKYNTGVLYLPWGYDLSMWGSTAMYLITWWFGFEFWKRELPFGIPLGNAMEFLLHFSAMANTPMVVVNIYNSYVQRTGKMRSFKEAIRPLWPLLAFMVLLLVWPFISPNDIMERDPRVLFMLSGTIFSNISCRLIVAQMSNTRCESFHWMTPIYVICIALGLWLPFLERFMLYFLFIITTLSHWHYGAAVVNQMCEHFNRICFSVHMRQPAGAANKKAKINGQSSMDSATTTALTTSTTNDTLASSSSATANSSNLETSSSQKLE